MRALLDADSLAFTDSVLEQRFLRLVQRAGLPRPRTQAWVNGFRVDFYWPDSSLVVEADGLRYHRTPTQQKRDRIRDQTHVAAGMTNLRFAAVQIRDEAPRVTASLRTVIARLQKAR